MGCSWASCGSKMLASWHNAMVDQKHLFTLLTNQLYATDVPGLQGERGESESEYLKGSGLPAQLWPSVITAALFSPQDDSNTTCQGCMSASIKQIFKTGLQLCGK